MPAPSNSLLVISAMFAKSFLDSAKQSCQGVLIERQVSPHSISRYSDDNETGYEKDGTDRAVKLCAVEVKGLGHQGELADHAEIEYDAAQNHQRDANEGTENGDSLFWLLPCVFLWTVIAEVEATNFCALSLAQVFERLLGTGNVIKSAEIPGADPIGQAFMPNIDIR
jgi:hypothetical protein